VTRSRHASRLKNSNLSVEEANNTTNNPTHVTSFLGQEAIFSFSRANDSRGGVGMESHFFGTFNI